MIRDRAIMIKLDNCVSTNSAGNTAARKIIITIENNARRVVVRQLTLAFVIIRITRIIKVKIKTTALAKVSLARIWLPGDMLTMLSRICPKTPIPSEMFRIKICQLFVLRNCVHSLIVKKTISRIVPIDTILVRLNIDI